MKIDRDDLDAARTGNWKMIRETSSYYEVAEELSGLVADSQTLREIAYSTICRVNKHRPGKRNLALILAAPKLLAALEAVMEGQIGGQPDMMAERFQLARKAIEMAKDY